MKRRPIGITAILVMTYLFLQGCSDKEKALGLYVFSSKDYSQYDISIISEPYGNTKPIDFKIDIGDYALGSAFLSASGPYLALLVDSSRPRILHVGQDHALLYINLSNSSIDTITHDNFFNHINYSWHPFKPELYYAVYNQADGGIYRYDINTGRRTPILTAHEGPGYYGYVRVSPDGNNLIYGDVTAEGAQIFQSDLAGNNRRRILEPVWSFVDVLQWIDKGHQILFSDFDSWHRIKRYNMQSRIKVDVDSTSVRSHDNYVSPTRPEMLLWEMPQDTVHQVSLLGLISGQKKTLQTGRAFRGLCWSSDGNYIFYISGEEGERKIYMMDRLGNDLHLLTDQFPYAVDIIQGDMPN